MTRPRSSLVCLQQTPYYHVVARCVRRAWLWGFDEYAGRDYSHRKAWVLERLEELSKVFAVDVCAYAVMSNHYHLVVHVDAARVRGWFEQDVVERWTRLFSTPRLIVRWRDGSASEAEAQAARALIEGWRTRLCDVSWYMRCLNEQLARRANAEDECTGRFWEGRFKSQALLDEAGLLAAMAYVDLNPIRAGIAATPETSEFSSIQTRILRLLMDRGAPAGAGCDTSIPLLEFQDQVGTGVPAIPFDRNDYLALVDWSGRVVRPDKRGAIDPALPTLLTRLNIDCDAWQEALQPKGNVFGRALRQLGHLQLHAHALGREWMRTLYRVERGLDSA